jgi:hypothetical protein
LQQEPAAHLSVLVVKLLHDHLLQPSEETRMQYQSSK